MKLVKSLYHFFLHIVNNMELLKTLILNDFKKQYFGSYLGLFWAYAQPITFIIVIWFVFEIGFRTNPNTNGTPFFLWLVCGIIPWFLIANTLTNGSNSIVSNSFLVKKVNFRLSILPLVQVGSSLIIHLSLVLVLIFSSLMYGYSPSFYWIQIVFYLFCSIYMLVGVLWLTSSLRVFIKDISSFISVLVQMGFWATPIFWSSDLIPEKYLWIIKLNPANYIVEGYRDTFINQTWFWERGNDTLLFFSISTIFFILGAYVFKKLRPHFADVL